MKLYYQLILFVVGATAIPLLVGFFVLKHGEDQLEARLLESRQEAAVRISEVVSRELSEVIERIQGARGYFTLTGATKEELTGMLRVVYKQSEDIVQVALLDPEGKQKAPGVYLDRPEKYPQYLGRLGVSEQDHIRFLAGLPRKKGMAVEADSVVVSTPHPLPGGKSLGVSIVVPWIVEKKKKKEKEEKPKKPETERWLAAIELSLEPVIQRVIETGDTRGFQAWLVDSEGKAIAHPDRSRITAGADLTGVTAVGKLLSGIPRGAFIEADTVYGFAALPLMGWGVVVSQSRTEAWAEIRRARRITVAWTGVSILALLLLGGLFTGRITRNLRRFVGSAEEFAKGNLDARVTLESKDELGVLAKTFNHMGEELKASREEIEAWNRELARRVEERTRELAEAHKRLLETSKLAAIGQLGAGVAHEINNPLVGILGNVQLMMMKLKDSEKNLETLRKIEVAAKRCKEVTTNLLRFSEQEADQEHVECSLTQVLKDAYSMTEQRITSQGIETTWELSDDLPRVMGDHRQLMQVFLNLFANARTAMESGGKLTISAGRLEDGLLHVTVADTGKGIAPEALDRIFEPFFTTKDVWTNTGLGLSVVYRIVSDHGGQITADSEPGKGSTFKVTLPVAGASA